MIGVMIAILVSGIIIAGAIIFSAYKIRRGLHENADIVSEEYHKRHVKLGR